MLLTKYPVIGQYQPNQSLTKLKEVLLSPATFRKVSTELNLEQVLVLHPVDLRNSLSRDFNYPRNQFLTSTEVISRRDWRCPGYEWAFSKGQSVEAVLYLGLDEPLNLYLLLQKSEVCHYSDTIQGEEWGCHSQLPCRVAMEEIMQEWSHHIRMSNKGRQKLDLRVHLCSFVVLSDGPGLILRTHMMAHYCL